MKHTHQAPEGDFYNLKTPKAYGKPRSVKKQPPVFAFGDGDTPGSERFFYLDEHWISWIWNDTEGWEELPPSSTILALQWLDHVTRPVFNAAFKKQREAQKTDHAAAKGTRSGAGSASAVPSRA